MKIDWVHATKSYEAARAVWDADPIGTDDSMMSLNRAENELILTAAPDASALARKVEIAVGDGRILAPGWRAAIIADLDRLAA